MCCSLITASLGSDSSSDVSTHVAMAKDISPPAAEALTLSPKTAAGFLPQYEQGALAEAGPRCSNFASHDITDKHRLIASTPIPALNFSPGHSSYSSETSPGSVPSQNPSSPRKSLRRQNTAGRIRYRYRSGGDHSSAEGPDRAMVERREESPHRAVVERREESPHQVVVGRREESGSPGDDCVIVGVVTSPVKHGSGPSVTSPILPTKETSNLVARGSSSLQSMLMDNSALPLFTERLETLVDEQNLSCADASAFADMPERSDQSSNSYLTASGPPSPSLLQASSPGNVSKSDSTASQMCLPFLSSMIGPSEKELAITPTENSGGQPNGDLLVKEGTYLFGKEFPESPEEIGHERRTVSLVPTERVHYRSSGAGKKKRKLVLQQSTLSQHMAVTSDPPTASHTMVVSPSLPPEQPSPCTPSFIPPTPWPQRKVSRISLEEGGDSGESATCSEDEATMAILPETDLADCLLPPSKRSHLSYSSSDQSSQAEDNDSLDDDYILVPPTSTGGGLKENVVCSPNNRNETDLTRSICHHPSPAPKPPTPLDVNTTQVPLKSPAVVMVTK